MRRNVSLGLFLVLLVGCAGTSEEDWARLGLQRQAAEAAEVRLKMLRDERDALLVELRREQEQERSLSAQIQAIEEIP